MVGFTFKCRRGPKRSQEEKQNLETLRKIGIPIIWMYGGPSSGKRTQSEMIAEEFGFIVLYRDTVINVEAMEMTMRGMTVSACLERNDPVPSELVIEVLKEALLAHMKISPGYVICNFPLTAEEGVAFERTVCPATLVIFLRVTPSVMRDRNRNKELARRLRERMVKADREGVRGQHTLAQKSLSRDVEVDSDDSAEGEEQADKTGRNSISAKKQEIKRANAQPTLSGSATAQPKESEIMVQPDAPSQPRGSERKSLALIPTPKEDLFEPRPVKTTSKKFSVKSKPTPEDNIREYLKNNPAVLGHFSAKMKAINADKPTIAVFGVVKRVLMQMCQAMGLATQEEAEAEALSMQQQQQQQQQLQQLQQQKADQERQDEDYDYDEDED